MAEEPDMSQSSTLAPEQLEAEISKWTRALRSRSETPRARGILKALLLEKEFRHVAAFTEGQLEAAISRYEGKTQAGDRGAAKVLERLLRERSRRRRTAAAYVECVHPGRPTSSSRKFASNRIFLVSTSGALLLVAAVLIGRSYASWRDDADFAAATELASESWQDLEGRAVCYERYLAAYPNGAHAREAKDHAEFFRAEQIARDAGNNLKAVVASYERYLEQCPSGLHAEKAADHVAFFKAVWSEGGCEDNAAAALASHERYLSSHPQGEHAAEARDRVAFLKAALVAGNAEDDAARAMAAYERYLRAHPQGIRAAEARDHVAFLRATQKARAATKDPAVALAAYRRYMAWYPRGRHAAEARDHVAFLGAVQAELRTGGGSSKAVDAYEQYLTAHPEGQHASAARSRIDNLTAIKPLGFFVANEVPGPETIEFHGRWAERRYLPLTLKDKSKRFLVVVASIRSDQFIPTETKYQQLKTRDAEMDRTDKAPYPPRDHVRFYDPKRFFLVLGNGHAYPGDALGNYSFGLFSCTTEGFVNGTKCVAFHKSPPQHDKRETIAIGFVLPARDCEPPFSLGLNDRQPVDVPVKKLRVPRGR